MGNRRLDGDGSLKKRSNGIWEYRIVVGADNDGKQLRKSFYSKSKTAARQKAKDYLHDLENQTVALQESTLSKWADKWLQTYKKGTVSVATYDGYVGTIAHIKQSPLGNMKLTDIKPIHVIEFLSSKKHMSTSQVKKMKFLLSSMFEAAIDNDICYKNPVRNTPLPTAKAPKIRPALSEQEVQTILSFAPHHPFGLAIVFMLMAGLRRGEVVGLMWSDIDMKNWVLYLRRSIAKGEGRELLVVDSNSTKNHNRDIPLPKQIRGLISAAYKNKTSLYVVHSPSNGIMNFDTFRSSFKSFFAALDRHCEENDLPHVQSITSHSLRHTYATIMKRRDVDLKDVQVLLGHSDYKMTADVYTHVDIDDLRKAVDKI